MSLQINSHSPHFSDNPLENTSLQPQKSEISSNFVAQNFRPLETCSDLKDKKITKQEKLISKHSSCSSLEDELLSSRTDPLSPGSSEGKDSSSDRLELTSSASSRCYSVISPEFAEPTLIEIPERPNPIEINLEARRAWIDHNGATPREKIILEDLVTKIHKVSYQEFVDHLSTSLNNFKQQGITDYVTLIEPGKSNQWVAEIIHHELGTPSPYYCRLGQSDAYYFIKAKEEGLIPKGINDFLLVDDGSFSGTQLHNHASQIFQKIPNARIHIIVPFISSTAINKIRELNGKYRIYSSYHMKTIQEMYPTPSPTTTEPSHKHNNKTQKKASSKNKISRIQPPTNQEKLNFIVNLFSQSKDRKQQQQMSQKCLTWFEHHMPNEMSFPMFVSEGLCLNSSQSYRFIPEFDAPYRKRMV